MRSGAARSHQCKWGSWAQSLRGVGSGNRGEQRSGLRPLTWVSGLRKLRPFWLTARMLGAGTARLLQLWMKKKEEPNMGEALRRPGQERDSQNEGLISGTRLQLPVAHSPHPPHCSQRRGAPSEPPVSRLPALPRLAAPSPGGQLSLPRATQSLGGASVKVLERCSLQAARCDAH